MKMHIAKCLFIFLCCTCIKAKAQSGKIDSLQKTFYNANQDATKLNNLLALGTFHQSIQKDSLYRYAKIASRYAQKQTDKGYAAIMLINAYLRLDKIDSAENLINNILPNYNIKEALLRNIYFDLSALKVDCFGAKTNYEDAMAGLYKIISQAEQYKNFPVLAKNLNTLGVINYNLNHVPEAFSCYFKALANCQNGPEYYSPKAVLYINLAETYRWVGNTDSAIYCINKATPLCEADGNLFYLANALRVKASIYKTQKNFPLAEKTMLDCIAIRQKTEGKLPLSNEKLALASIYLKWNKTDKAIEELTKALALNDSLNIASGKLSGGESDILRISGYRILANCYKQKGDEKNYAAILENLIAAQDAFYEANSAKAIAELQAKYELQKKESIIIKQQLDIARKNYLTYGLLMLVAFVLLISWLVFKNFRRKQKIKMEFALQEEKRIATQSIIDAEEQERKRIAADLHDNIGAYASAIRADVEKITTLGSAQNKESLKNLEQHSQEIINSLRDTIWVLNKENITIIGISDRIKNYVSKLQPSYNHLQFQINEKIENNLRVTSQKALNIFRIVQEAIHNAIKHSNANNITIEILSKEKLMITINDDGKGLDENTAAAGNGLTNMKSRAAGIGMVLSIAANSDKGTTVCLQTGTTN